MNEVTLLQSAEAVNPVSFKMGDNDVKMYNNEPIFRLGFIGECLEANPSTVSMWKDLVKPDELVEFNNVELGGHPVPWVKQSGFYKILLRVRSPKAEPFVEWVTREVLPSIMKTGSYAVSNQPIGELEGKLRAASFLLEQAGIVGNPKVLSLDQMFRKEVGYSALEATNTRLVAPVQTDRLDTPTNIGIELGISGKAVNKKLASLGLQYKIDKDWFPTDEGLKYGVLVDTTKKHSNGRPVQQLLWYKSRAIELLK